MTTNQNPTAPLDSTDDASEARYEYFDQNYPGWETRDRFVDYADVDRPDETLVMRTFGSDHRGLLYGAY
jgi:hypothetical protein